MTTQFSDALLPILRELSYHCEHDLTCQHAAQCYASIINKLPQGKSLIIVSTGEIWDVLYMCIGNALLFLDKQLLEMWSELNGTESSPSTRLRVLNLWVWVSKALLMRGHPSGMDTATKV